MATLRFDDDEDWGLGTYQAVAPQEPDLGVRAKRLKESRDAAQKLWNDIQKLLVPRG